MARYIIADDLTGACDAALASAKRGLRTRVWLDARGIAVADCDRNVDVVAIDLHSRDRPPDCAAARTTALLERLALPAPAELVKKIDSTLRGNVASETCAILTALPNSVAIVAPSLPAQGRTIRDGLLYERERRIEHASLRDMFAGVPFVPIGLATLRAGGAALAATLASLGTNGIRIAIADAETDADLRALVRATHARDDIVWVGSSGIVEALAAVALEGAKPAPRIDVAARISGDADRTRVLFLIGSRTATTREQIADFEQYWMTETIDADALVRAEPGVRAAIARASTALDDSCVALVAIGGTAYESESAVRAAFIAATAPLWRDRTGLTIVLSGGAIARAFCDAAGVVGLDVYDEIAAGTPRSRAIGAPLWIVTKAGGFGAPHAYREVLASLRERTAV